MTLDHIVTPHTRELAPAINAAHEAAVGAAHSALQHARRAGELLIQAKAAVPHGEWLSWLAEYCPHVGARQAQKYMRLAEGWPAVEANTNPDSHLTIDSAVRLLAEPRTPALERHPAASWVPAMRDNERAMLRTSIQAHGVLVPIALCDGMVLDGWERYLACRELGIECPTEPWNAGGHYRGTPAAYVRSANLMRGHWVDAFAEAAAVAELDGLQERLDDADVTIADCTAIMARCDVIAAEAGERRLRATRILGQIEKQRTADLVRA